MNDTQLAAERLAFVIAKLRRAGILQYVTITRIVPNGATIAYINYRR